MPLYSVLAKPNLEYWVQFGALLFKQDVQKLERFQRQARKMIEVSESKSYKERIRKLGMFSLEKSRLSVGHVIVVFKYLKGCHTKKKNCFPLPQGAGKNAMV